MNVLDALLEYERRGGKVLFWFCPNSCDGQVNWTKTADQYVATCAVCGHNSAAQSQNGHKNGGGN